MLIKHNRIKTGLANKAIPLVRILKKKGACFYDDHHHPEKIMIPRHANFFMWKGGEERGSGAKDDDRMRLYLSNSHTPQSKGRNEKVIDFRIRSEIIW
mmetsp:Transcript_2233/g.3376  ORF Transcript_2233/g.3376 Transcript_2233/m.3376 type:complete len:98 (-) Transcript_2233:1633-1926(-)